MSASHWCGKCQKQISRDTTVCPFCGVTITGWQEIQDVPPVVEAQQRSARKNVIGCLVFLVIVIVGALVLAWQLPRGSGRAATEGPPVEEPAPEATPVPESAPDAAGLVAEGFAAKDEGDYEAARAKFEAAIRADDTNWEAHWGLAWILVEDTSPEGQEQARAEFQKVLALSPPEDIRAEAEDAIARIDEASGS